MALADEYPGDVGIEGDAATVLVERFEDSVAAIAGRWSGSTTLSSGFVTDSLGQTRNTSGMSIVADAPADSPGTNCLQMTAVGGTSTGGHLYRDLGTIDAAGYAELYVRYYVKYPAGGTRHHNGLWLLGQNPHSVFLPSTTGQPAGSDRFYVGLEPEHPLGTLGFTAYAGWMEMKALADGVTYIGNTFDQVTLTAGPWFCIEARMKMNSPVSGRSGELQLWVDDVEIFNLTEGAPLGGWSQNQWTTGAGSTPFEGFRWRSTTDLSINGLWLNHLSDGNGAGVTTTMRWDHLVVATERIGPLSTGSSLGVAEGSYALTGSAATPYHTAVQAWLRLER